MPPLPNSRWTNAAPLTRYGKSRASKTGNSPRITRAPLNSLGQACATLLAQAKGESSDKDAHKRLFDHLEDWLCGSDAPVGLNKPLMNALVQSDQATYFHAQSEALAYLVWLKKFAQAFIVKSANTKSTSH